VRGRVDALGPARKHRDPRFGEVVRERFRELFALVRWMASPDYCDCGPPRQLSVKAELGRGLRKVRQPRREGRAPKQSGNFCIHCPGDRMALARGCSPRASMSKTSAFPYIVVAFPT
jgi:hypothetical protein